MATRPTTPRETPADSRPARQRGLRLGGGRTTPNKATQEIKAAAKAIVERPAYRASLDVAAHALDERSHRMTANSSARATRRGGFKKGESGNPAGRRAGVPNKATREIRDAATAIVEDARYRARLAERLIDGKAPHMEVLLHHYAYGKPKEIVEVEGRLDVPSAVTFLITGPVGAENQTE